MFNRFSFIALLFTVSVLHAGDEKLVPAQFNQRADSGGNMWDIQSNGGINDGNNDCFDSGAMLLINSREFNSSEQLQTMDGSELILSSRMGTLGVARRVLVDSKRNAVRYLEIVTNSSNKKQQVIIEVRSNLGGQAMTSVWNDGNPAGTGPLVKKNVALGAIHQPGNNRPGVVWIIGEAGAVAPPTVEINNQHSYMIRYTFELAPQQSRAVLHYVLQRPGLIATQMADVVKPLWKSQLIKPVIPPAIKRLLINFRGSAAGEEDPDATKRLPVIAALLERAGVEDTGSKTLVGVGRSEAERMTGSLSGGPLMATSEYGEVSIAVDELAGSEGSGFRTLLHLRSGETITAHALKGELRLETEAGVELPVDPSQVAWMVTKRVPTEGTAPADQLGVLILTDGTRLAVSTMAVGIPVISAFGQATVAFDQFASIQRMNEPPGWFAIMRDGSRLRVLPAVKEIEIATCRFGVRRVLTTRIAGYQRSGKNTPSDDDREDGAHLDSEERFYAGLAGPTLTLKANGTDTVIPVERIVAIERPEDSSGLAILLRDGGRLVGTTNDGIIALLAGGQTWRVPVRRLLQWQAPKPPEPPEPPEVEKEEQQPPAAEEKSPVKKKKTSTKKAASENEANPFGGQVQP